MGRGLAGLVFGSFRPVIEVAFLLFGKDVIDHGSGNTEGSGGVGDVIVAGGEVLQDGPACGCGVDGSQGLVINKGARLHSVSSPGPPGAGPAA